MKRWGNMSKKDKPTLTTYKPLKRNPNRGSKRNSDLLQTSLEQGGIGRSIVVAASGEILAGNHVYEQAGASFEDLEIIEVETTGNQLVVVKRTDLPNADDPRAKALILGDNRAGDADRNWDVDVIQELLASD